MITKKRLNKSSNQTAMSFIELLIVTSLMTIVSIALYQTLSNGIKVWEKGNQVVLEEEIVIFFDKLTKDVRNSYKYANIKLVGNRYKFNFPTMVVMPVDQYISVEEDVYTEQMGRVEYYYDYNKNNISRKEANYSQAITEKFMNSRVMVRNVEALRFRYYYITDTGEIYSEDILDAIPSRIEVEVSFMDNGYVRKMNKFIDIPIGS
ncbi:MAG: hypothetical protein ACI9F2_000103 [Lysobacterales bacterium]|jgi:hypothetical protein